MSTTINITSGDGDLLSRAKAQQQAGRLTALEAKKRKELEADRSKATDQQEGNDGNQSEDPLPYQRDPAAFRTGGSIIIVGCYPVVYGEGEPFDTAELSLYLNDVPLEPFLLTSQTVGIFGPSPMTAKIYSNLNQNAALQSRANRTACLVNGFEGVKVPASNRDGYEWIKPPEPYWPYVPSVPPNSYAFQYARMAPKPRRRANTLRVQASRFPSRGQFYYWIAMGEANPARRRTVDFWESDEGYNFPITPVFQVFVIAYGDSQDTLEVAVGPEVATASQLDNATLEFSGIDFRLDNYGLLDP